MKTQRGKTLALYAKANILGLFPGMKKKEMNLLGVHVCSDLEYLDIDLTSLAIFGFWVMFLS